MAIQYCDKLASSVQDPCLLVRWPHVIHTANGQPVLRLVYTHSQQQLYCLIPEPLVICLYLRHLLMCSDVLLLESSASLSRTAGKPSIQVTCPPATAQALATSLVDCTISSKTRQKPEAYQMLCQLALADVQAGNERMKGVAQHAISAILKVTIFLI